MYIDVCFHKVHSIFFFAIFFLKKKAKYKERPLLFFLVTFSILFVCLFKLGGPLITDGVSMLF